MTEHQVPAKKQTDLGRYVTAREAHDMWRNHPEGVVIIDVRTPEEYIFVGHPEMARNIPLLFVRYQWDHEKDAPVVEPNPDFVSSVAAAFKPTDTLLLMCRSGSRSALAVNALAQAGFHHVYNIVDGMEGDKVDDEESAYHGKRMRNGWKNSGLPWTYDVDPPLLWTSPRL